MKDLLDQSSDHSYDQEVDESDLFANINLNRFEAAQGINDEEFDSSCDLLKESFFIDIFFSDYKRDEDEESVTATIKSFKQKTSTFFGL